jgi:hypothetical protein
VGCVEFNLQTLFEEELSVMMFKMNKKLSNEMINPPLSSSDPASPVDCNCEEVQKVTAEILEIFGSLTSEADLQPRKEINDKFSSLVSLCIKPRDNCVVSAVLSHPSVQQIAPQLREMCSQAEGHLETFWARQIIDAISGSIRGGLSSF